MYKSAISTHVNSTWKTANAMKGDTVPASTCCSSNITVHNICCFPVSLSARRRKHVHKLQLCTYTFAILLPLAFLSTDAQMHYGWLLPADQKLCQNAAVSQNIIPSEKLNPT